MKTPILKKMQDWSPKVRKARVKKQELVVSATPTAMSYKKIFNDWNCQ